MVFLVGLRAKFAHGINILLTRLGLRIYDIHKLRATVNLFTFGEFLLLDWLALHP